MNVGQTIPLADTWSMHGDIGAGWWIVMVIFWGFVIVAGARMLRGTFDESKRPIESPIEILERRFAEGALSADDYRERREILVNRDLAADTDTGREPAPSPLPQRDEYIEDRHEVGATT